MFKNEANYEFFLKQYDKYLSEYVDTYAFCLLGNHFHLLISIKDFPLSIEDKDKSIHEIVSHQFRKFFQSYSMAFNKQHDRIGTLFQTPFKRALVDNDTYFTRLVYYIHANPQLHEIIDNFREWKWSSYQRIMIDKPTKLMKNEVLNWFGDKHDYVNFHQNVNYHQLDSIDIFDKED
jgi:REP element-mobilizing transposase RayT